MSRASTRIHIRWPPAPASEPTDTLVLSVGEYYVDLRVRKDDGSIDWALAGQRIVLSRNPDKVSFSHAIDSHHNPNSSAPPAPDVGDFTELPNGDDLETGAMPNPDADGKVMDYEEIWRELDWSSGMTGGNVNWILESADDEPSASEKTKTFCARLGRYYLALRQVVRGEEVSFVALRQDFDPDSQKWKTRYQIGNVNGLLTMDETSDIEGDTKHWKLGQKVNVKESVCVVRAVSTK